MSVGTLIAWWSASRSTRPATRRGLAVALWSGAIAGGLAGITTALAVLDAHLAGGVRHAYFLPVVAAALRFGLAGGGVAALVAVLLDAPFVLAGIERQGLTAPAVQALATLVLLLLVGVLGGGLATQSAREATRYRRLAAVQEALADEAPLHVALDRLRANLPLPAATTLALVVLDGDELVVSGPRIVPGAAAASALARGRPVFVPDAGGTGRVRRVLAAPLTARGVVVGALAVERVGELGPGERAALVTLGAHIGLALENARLAARQRRFGDELAAKVAAATRHLEEMDHAKSAFVATTSHELRTPLTALLGFSELLAVRRFPPPEVRRLAQIMQRETERLVRIVDDLLDLSRLERGLAPALRRAPLRVEAVVLGAVEVFRRHQVAHHFEIDCPEGLPHIDADADAVDRVLKNLIGNAIKYSPPGVVRVGARAVANAVELSVEDHGRGISPAALPHVFEPYFRAPEAAGAARGTGIGLAVVKALVEAHGGTIGVESAPAKGTRIRFTLPAVP